MDAINQQCLIVILNWNGTTDTVSCCDSLASARGDFDVLIVDNNSSDSQYELLTKGFHNELKFKQYSNKLTKFSQAKNYNIKEEISFIDNERKFIIFRSMTNHGFSRGCNIGAKYASEQNYKKILFLNNDTVVENDFLVKMLDTLENCEGVIPQIRFYFDKNIIWNCGGEINRFGKRTYHFANQAAEKIPLHIKQFRISFTTGCCLLFRTKYFEDIGMFTEKFFFGEEDIDLSLRLLKLNAKLICRTDAIIYHKVGASLSGDHKRLLRKAYIHYLNRFVNMKLHLGGLWFLWLVPALLKTLINTYKINKLSLPQSVIFSWRLFCDSMKLKEVNKDKFHEILTNGY